MGGCSTIGYENHNGSVSYTCVHDAGPSDLEYYCMNNRVETDLVAQSINEYFSEELYEKEDSACRLLIRLDGTGSCRGWGRHGEFIWRPLPPHPVRQ
jgi:hypothetical protein